MPDLLEREMRSELRVDGDEKLARRELRRQIGRLEAQLASFVGDAFQRVRLDTAIPSTPGGQRLLGLGELEAIRDSLADRVAEARVQLRTQDELETRNRELLERMIESPADFKWVRISRDDIGEPGCGHWHSRPRFGLLGMLMGWWRVRVSSGCPLPGRLAAVER